MRHRITGNLHTGLGNPTPVLLDNTGELSKGVKKFMHAAFKLYKPLKYGCDYKIIEGQVIIGREPAYQFQRLFIIALNRDKGLSYLQTGYAFGGYGSGIKSRYKFYKDYKNDSKFIKFIDTWHDQIFP